VGSFPLGVLASRASAAEAEERTEPARREQHGGDLPHQESGSTLAVIVPWVSAARSELTAFRREHTGAGPGSPCLAIEG
jgi:hypothetical protein